MMMIRCFVFADASPLCPRHRLHYIGWQPNAFRHYDFEELEEDEDNETQYLAFIDRFPLRFGDGEIGVIFDESSG